MKKSSAERMLAEEVELSLYTAFRHKRPLHYTFKDVEGNGEPQRDYSGAILYFGGGGGKGGVEDRKKRI